MKNDLEGLIANMSKEELLQSEKDFYSFVPLKSIQRFLNKYIFNFYELSINQLCKVIKMSDYFLSENQAVKENQILQDKFISLKEVCLKKLERIGKSLMRNIVIENKQNLFNIAKSQAQKISEEIIKIKIIKENNEYRKN